MLRKIQRPRSSIRRRARFSPRNRVFGRLTTALPLIPFPPIPRVFFQRGKYVAGSHSTFHHGIPAALRDDRLDAVPPPADGGPLGRRRDGRTLARQRGRRE